MMYLFPLRFNDYLIYKGRSMSIISGRKNVRVGPRFEHKTAVFQSQCSQARQRSFICLNLVCLLHVKNNA